MHHRPRRKTAINRAILQTKAINFFENIEKAYRLTLAFQPI
jgi:hypothetical protein